MSSTADKQSRGILSKTGQSQIYLSMAPHLYHSGRARRRRNRRRGRPRRAPTEATLRSAGTRLADPASASWAIGGIRHSRVPAPLTRRWAIPYRRSVRCSTPSRPTSVGTVSGVRVQQCQHRISGPAASGPGRGASLPRGTGAPAGRAEHGREFHRRRRDRPSARRPHRLCLCQCRASWLRRARSRRAESGAPARRLFGGRSMSMSYPDLAVENRAAWRA